ncbi:MAG: hypothetical protein K0R85_2579, partial [Devosia sp.]|nr:hypothetical protein [Devosia sp.]
MQGRHAGGATIQACYLSPAPPHRGIVTGTID